VAQPTHCIYLDFYMTLKAIKITNPLWLGSIGPRINEFCQKVPIDGIVYESLYAYFAQVVQFGGGKSEFWSVFDEENKPQLFVQWSIRDLPHIGVAHGGFIYSWCDNPEAVELAFKEFVAFAARNRAPIMEIDIRNEAVVKVLNQHADKFGYDVKNTGVTNLIVRKKEE